MKKSRYYKGNRRRVINCKFRAGHRWKWRCRPAASSSDGGKQRLTFQHRQAVQSGCPSLSFALDPLALRVIPSPALCFSNNTAEQLGLVPPLSRAQLPAIIHLGNIQNSDKTATNWNLNCTFIMPIRGEKLTALIQTWTLLWRNLPQTPDGHPCVKWQHNFFAISRINPTPVLIEPGRWYRTSKPHLYRNRFENAYVDRSPAVCAGFTKVWVSAHEKSAHADENSPRAEFWVDKRAVGQRQEPTAVTSLFSLDLQFWQLVLLVFVGSLRCRIIIKVFWKHRWTRKREQTGDSYKKKFLHIR
jgi:hypothetical protein